MPGFKIQTFSGLNKKIGPRLIPEDMAQTAQNCLLDSGRLEPIPADENDASESGNTHPASHITTSTKTIYKAGSTSWFTFTDDVDVIKSPVKEDSHGRFYWTGQGGSSGYPRVVSTAAGITGSGPYPATNYRLGLPPAPAFSAAILAP